MNEEERMERLTTGVPGLDRILDGGLPRGGVFIVEGPPGAGKTILGNQIAFYRASCGERATYVTLLAEAHARMIAHLRRMTFFDASYVSKRVQYLSAFKALEDEGLEGLLSVLRRELTARKTALLVLDGVSSIEASAATPRDLKKFVYELQIITAMLDCTTLLLSSGSGEALDTPEYTMVDGVLRLTNEVVRLRTLRRLHVQKLRGSSPVPGRHTLEISDEGIRVHQRLETRYRPEQGAGVAPAGERMHFGISALDEMMRGGLPSNSTTMILGPSGSGKTVLGLHFLAAGAAEEQPGLYFGFYERPALLLSKAERVRLDFARAHERGLLHLLWQPPVEALIDTLAQRLLDTVEEHRIQRLFIDGIQAFQQSADEPERLREVLSTLVDELQCRGVTTVYSVETADLFGPRIELPTAGLSAVTQNLVMLRHVELRAELRRLISILKLRDSDYDSRIREFRVAEGGIRVADTFESANNILSGMAQVLVGEESTVRGARRGRTAPKKKRGSRARRR